MEKIQGPFDIATAEAQLEELRKRIAKAIHKPGQWNESIAEPQAITTVSKSEQEARALEAQEGGWKEKMIRILMSTGTGKFGEIFDKRDLRLVVAAVNALPMLMELAEETLKHRVAEKQHT